MYSDEDYVGRQLCLLISDKAEKQKETERENFMSSKRKDGKKCPGVSKQGNPCKNYFNDNDPEGLCGRCRRRANTTAKAEKKAARRKAKLAVAAKPQPSLDYNPEEVLACKARPGVCHAEVKVGIEGSDDCAMAVNPSKMADITRHNRSQSNPLEKARFELARGLQSQLYSLGEGGGPFPVCGECQQGLIELFERDDIFLPFSFARRKYMERQGAEKERQERAEAKARERAEEISVQQQQRKKEQQRKEEQQVQKASAFMAGLTVVSSGQKPEEGNNDPPSLTSLTRGWMHDLIAGKHNDAHVHPVFLPKVETDEVHQCSNPHCNARGTMADVARRDDGTVVLIQREGEDVPLPKMWISWQPLRLTHKQGNLQGQEITDPETGAVIVKKKPVVLCSQCGNVLRRTPRGDEPPAYTTPLSAAVEKAVTNRRLRRAERRRPSDLNHPVVESSSRSRRGRGRKGGMKAHHHHDFGYADPEDLRAFCDGGNSAVATLGEVVKKPKLNC